MHVFPLPSCRQSNQERLPLEPWPTQLHHTAALTAPDGAVLCRSSENVPLPWAELAQERLQAHRAGSWELLGARGCCLALLRRGAARRCPADAIGVPTSGQLNWHSHHEKPVYLGKWGAATGLQHHWKITVRQREAKQQGSEFLQTT